MPKRKRLVEMIEELVTISRSSHIDLADGKRLNVHYILRRRSTYFPKDDDLSVEGGDPLTGESWSEIVLTLVRPRSESELRTKHRKYSDRGMTVMIKESAFRHHSRENRFEESLKEWLVKHGLRGLRNSVDLKIDQLRAQMRQQEAI